MTVSRFVYGLAVVMSTALIASCGGGSPSLLNQSAGVDGTSQAQSIFPARGGAFSASYSGTYTFTPCVHGKINGAFGFSGAGSASFLRKSSEMGGLGSSNLTCGSWSGSAVLSSTRHPDDTITVSLSGGDLGHPPPCSLGHCNFSVTAGTGRFAHATGSGTMHMSLNRGSNTYSDTWSGTLQF